MFSSYNGINLEINNKDNRKSPNTWKLNNVLLNNLWVKKEVSKENFKRHIELNENENMTYQNLWRDFPGGAAVKNPPANAGDTGSSPGPGRSHMPRSN